MLYNQASKQSDYMDFTIAKLMGFTLAEVLITLAIIGVIASMTIPSLINSTNDAEIISAAKKSFAELSEALLMMRTDNYSCLDFSTTNHSALRNCFASQFKVIKSGKNADLSNNTVYAYYKNPGTVGSNTATDPNDDSFRTADNFQINFSNSGNNCTGTDGSLTKICGAVYVDVNATKTPNQIGYDLLGFWLIKNNDSYNITPMGTGNDSNSCASPSSNILTSLGCTAKIITNSSLP